MVVASNFHRSVSSRNHDGVFATNKSIVKLFFVKHILYVSFYQIFQLNPSNLVYPVLLELLSVPGTKFHI